MNLLDFNLFVGSFKLVTAYRPWIPAATKERDT